MTSFSNQLAFITGGSSGIGLATARLLAEKGCGLVLFARGKAKLDEACDGLGKYALGPEQTIAGLSMDVSDAEDVRKTLDEAVQTYGCPDILINSAGVSAGDYFENIGDDLFDRTMKINVYGTRNTISALLPHMKEKGAGHIVNLSSAAGLIGMFGYSLYSSTKYALVGMSECLRSEFKRFNIAVTVVCPPEVTTPLIETEAETLPPESRLVKSMAGLLSPEAVARDIVRGIEKKTFMVVPGFKAKMMYFFHRIGNGRLTRTPSDWLVRLGAWRGRRLA